MKDDAMIFCSFLFFPFNNVFERRSVCTYRRAKKLRKKSHQKCIGSFYFLVLCSSLLFLKMFVLQFRFEQRCRQKAQQNVVNLNSAQRKLSEYELYCLSR